LPSAPDESEKRSQKKHNFQVNLIEGPLNEYDDNKSSMELQTAILTRDLSTKQIRLTSAESAKNSQNDQRDTSKNQMNSSLVSS